MDLIFQALAHETRRTILDLLRDEPGQAVGKLSQNFDVSRIAIMNHLAVLENANLVVSEKKRSISKPVSQCDTDPTSLRALD